jgi:hypothetical protein
VVSVQLRISTQPPESSRLNNARISAGADAGGVGDLSGMLEFMGDDAGETIARQLTTDEHFQISVASCRHDLMA